MCSGGIRCLLRVGGCGRMVDWSKKNKKGMRLTFLKAMYGVDFKIPDSFASVVESTFGEGKKKNLAVFCSIQFREKLSEVCEFLHSLGFTTEISQPDRSSIEGQMLGCDSYADNLNLDLSGIDGFVYVGDGYFHPNALLFAQENEDVIKPVVLMNVVQQIVEVIDGETISSYLRKRKGNLLKFYTSSVVGVFVSSKWGQEFLESSLRLEEMFPDKSFYFFVADNFLDMEMENFPFVEVWVNSACPRIGQDDVVRHPKPVVNIKDVWKG